MTNKVSKKGAEFNDFRFKGMKWIDASNKYILVERISEDEKKVIVRVADNQIFRTKYGFALIIDHNHVVFLKEWQVDNQIQFYNILLNEEYFNVKEFGEHEDFGDSDGLDNFKKWVDIAKSQEELDGNRFTFWTKSNYFAI